MFFSTALWRLSARQTCPARRHSCWIVHWPHLYKKRQASTSERGYSLTSPKLKIQEPKPFTLGSSGKHPNSKLCQLINIYRHICWRRHEIDDRVLVHSQHSSNQRVEIPPAPRIVHRLAGHTVLGPILAFEIVINEQFKLFEMRLR